MPWEVQVWHWTSDFWLMAGSWDRWYNNDNHKCAVRQLKCDFFFEVIMRGHSVVIVSIHGSLAQIVRGLRCLVKDPGRFYNGSGVMQLERQNTEAGAICKRMAGLFRSSLGHAEPIFWIRDGIGHCNDPPSLDWHWIKTGIGACQIMKLDEIGCFIPEGFNPIAALKPLAQSWMRSYHGMHWFQATDSRGT
jgi:hypothetical protein